MKVLSWKEKRELKKLLKPRRNKTVGKKYWVFAASVFVTLVIAVIYAVFLISLWNSAIDNRIPIKSVLESTYIATGVDVIAIALAVWAGLNIVNAIERKEFESFNKNVSDVTKTELSLIIHDRDKEHFCQELYKSSEDPVSKIFFELFSKENIGLYPYSTLLEIEQLFYQVYKMHKSEHTLDYQLISRANNGIRLIKDIDYNYVHDELLTMYFQYRVIEFNFYKGYCDESTISRYKCFKFSAEGFLRIAPKFSVILPEYDENGDEVPDSTVIDNDLTLSVYFANSIGASYSRILQLRDGLINNKKIKLSKDDMIEYSKKALFYLKCAVTWNTEKDGSFISKREVYYRNYAVALENYDRAFGTIGDHSDIIISNYKMSLKLVLNYNESNWQRIWYSYRTLMFYLNVYINERIKTQNDFKELKNYIEYIATLKNTDSEIIRRIHELYTVSDLATNDFNLQTSVYCMKAFALRNILLMKSAQNKDIDAYFSNDISYYKKEFIKTMSILDYYEISDSFKEQLDMFRKTAIPYI